MPCNLEIKARCPDLARARERVQHLGSQRLGVDHQVDTYFQTRAGRLKLRESSLSGGQLVPYRRPDAGGPRRSDYQVVAVEDPTTLKGLLSDLLGERRVVRKEREIFLVENVRIHLDRVQGLGEFLELEAAYDGTPEGEREQQRKVARLMQELGVRETDLLGTSYEALLEGCSTGDAPSNERTRASIAPRTSRKAR